MRELIDIDESKRAVVVAAMQTMDAATRVAVDRVIRLASQLFHVPIAAATCAAGENQWFISHLGIDTENAGGIGSFCQHSIKSNDITVVENATLDHRFAENRFVTGSPHVRFYAAAPLVTREGYAIGCLSIMDRLPRSLSETDKQLLQDLADIVMTEVELRYAIGRIEPATRLPNRTQFIDDYAFMSHGNDNQEYTLIAFDIGSLQLLTVGRAIGLNSAQTLVFDSIRRIHQAIGTDTVLYQIGIASFCCLIPGNHHKGTCSSLNDIVTTLREPIVCGNIPISVPACAGVVQFTLGQSDPCDIIRMAYSALYSAREEEKAWTPFDEKQDKIHKRSFRLLGDAGKALESLSEFRLVFQPRLNIGSGKCVGVEALLRWNHPRLGSISPGEFIPLIEGTDLVRPLTEWVLDRGMAQARLWQNSGMDLRVSVNLSGRNLDETDFVERLQAKMDVHGLAPEFLELEFTESALPRNGTRAVERLNRIRNMGVEIAIDDFGTGYSNLSHLQRLPAQILKIDQSLVRFLTTNQRDQTIVRSTMAMAHELGYRVVIEGVEDRETRALIASWGCDEAQGYYFAKPLSPEALLRWMETPALNAQTMAL